MFLVEVERIVQCIGNLPLVSLCIVALAITIRTLIGCCCLGRTIVPIVGTSLLPLIATSCTPCKILDNVELYTSIHSSKTSKLLVCDSVISKNWVVRVVVVTTRNGIESICEVFAKHLLVGKANTTCYRLKNRLLQCTTKRATTFELGHLQGRREVETYALPKFVIDLGADTVLIVTMLCHDTILASIVVAEHILCLLATTRDIDIMCLSHTSRSEHLVLPVDTGTVAIFACYTVISACIEVGITYAATKKACESILVATKSLELILILHVILNAKQVELLAKTLETYITIIRNLSLAGLTALGSNKDYTIGTSSTINSCSRSILHHVDGLDIVDIHISQTIFHLETIHDVEWLGTLCDRRTTTYSNVDIGTWRTTLGNDVHTGSLTCQSLSGRSSRYIGKILTAD